MNPIYKRNIALCIFLSFITGGIYLLYWEYLLVKSVRAVKKDTSRYTGEVLCLFFIPFYFLYWVYTRGKELRIEVSGRGDRARSHEIVFLLLGLLGLGIVDLALMQKDVNGLPLESDESDLKRVRFEESFNVNALFDNMKKDISSMGYDIKDEMCEGSRFSFSAAKDLTPLDFVLGRQQFLSFALDVWALQDGAVEARLHRERRFGLDKIFCLLTGPFVFCINWIFMFLCFGNQNNTVKVAERSLQNYADKIKNNRKEKTE